MSARQYYGIVTSPSQVFAYLLTQYLIAPEVIGGVKIGDKEDFNSFCSFFGDCQIYPTAYLYKSDPHRSK